MQVGEQDGGAAYEGGGEGEQGPGDLGGDLQVGIFAKTNTNTITNTKKHPVTSELIFRSVNRRRASMAIAKSKKTDTSKTSISVQMKLPRLDFKWIPLGLISNEQNQTKVHKLGQMGKIVATHMGCFEVLGKRFYKHHHNPRK